MKAQQDYQNALANFKAVELAYNLYEAELSDLAAAQSQLASAKAALAAEPSEGSDPMETAKQNFFQAERDLQLGFGAFHAGAIDFDELRSLKAAKRFAYGQVSKLVQQRLKAA